MVKERLIKGVWQTVGVVATAFVLGLASTANATTYTDNVYIPTAQLQAAFLVETTTQFSATVSSSPWFVNTFTINVASQNPVTQCSTTTLVPCQLDQDVANMIAVSTNSYVYGWADGESSERYNDVLFISSFTTWCSSSSYWYPGVSTSTVIPQISSTTCNAVLDFIGNFIYTQFFSSPTVVPGH